MLVSTLGMKGIRNVYSGLGDAQPVQPSLPDYVTCPYPYSSACVAGNQALNDEYEQAMQQYQADMVNWQCQQNIATRQAMEPNYTAAMAAADSAACGAQVATEFGSSVANPVSTSAMNWQYAVVSNLSGTVAPGTQWTITITGAPNSPVTSSGTMPSGGLSVNYGPTAMGTTNSQGQLTLTGTIDASQIGAWTEGFYVGGTYAGAVQFNVYMQPSIPQTTVVTPNVPVTPTVSQSTVAATNPAVGSGTVANTNVTALDLFGDTSTPISVGSFSVGSYTAIGLGAAAVLLLVMMGRGGR